MMVPQLVRWLSRQGAATVLALRLNLTPTPASRPRVPRKGRPYYPVQYRTWRAQALDKLIDLAPPEPIEGPVVVVAEHVLPKPKTRTKSYPRGDVDNYAKATLDSMTHAEFWRDDDQVDALVTTKRYVNDDEEPHTKIYMFKV